MPPLPCLLLCPGGVLGAVPSRHPGLPEPVGLTTAPAFPTGFFGLLGLTLGSDSLSAEPRAPLWTQTENLLDLMPFLSLAGKGLWAPGN